MWPQGCETSSPAIGSLQICSHPPTPTCRMCDMSSNSELMLYERLKRDVPQRQPPHARAGEGVGRLGSYNIIGRGVWHCVFFVVSASRCVPDLSVCVLCVSAGPPFAPGGFLFLSLIHVRARECTHARHSHLGSMLHTCTRSDARSFRVDGTSRRPHRAYCSQAPSVC